jgi:rhodanese-related sulfurtransferase
VKQHSPRFLARVAQVRPHVTEVSAAEVKRRLDAREPFHLVDVREESEWAAGHLPYATHLSKGVLERDVEARIPDAGAPIVLYCGGGYRSALAADSLQRMGYTNVLSMEGGFRGWVEAGHPVFREPSVTS